MTAAEEFNAEIAAQALARIANGEVPSEFCTKWDTSVPDNAASIELWAKADPDFAERLKAAKQTGALVMVAECVKIADCQQTRPEHKKIRIDARMRLAALWSPVDCNPRTIVEQTTTHRLQTPRETFIQDAMVMLGMSREAAERQYDGRPMLTVVNG